MEKFSVLSLVLGVLAFSGWSLFFWNRPNVVPSTSDSEGCGDYKHHCEWQLTKMNETCNVLINISEDKLKKLHESDMNLAIIREQLHKEILELFWYEFQTFQRLHSSKSECVPQSCSEYCAKMSLKKHEEEYQEKMSENQHLVQKQHLLRLFGDDITLAVIFLLFVLIVIILLLQQKLVRTEKKLRVERRQRNVETRKAQQNFKKEREPVINSMCGMDQEEKDNKKHAATEAQVSSLASEKQTLAQYQDQTSQKSILKDL